MTKERLVEIKITNQVLAIIVVILSLSLGIVVGKQKGWIDNKPEPIEQSRNLSDQLIALEKPNLSNKTTLNQVLNTRRTRRKFNNQPILVNDISQMLWAMQGTTVDWGGRTTPTFKSAYPLSITLISKNVDGLEKGAYVYSSSSHSVAKVNDFKLEAALSLFNEVPSYQQAAAIFIISGNFNKIKEKFPDNPREELIYLEAGFASQNLFLQAESVGLGVNIITTFDQNIKNSFLIPEDETLISIMPVGYASEN